MSTNEVLLPYVSRLGDNALVLGQRMSELVTAMPDLEEELANANFALDYLGQARMFYSCAAEIEGRGRTEDDFAFLRDESEFRNLLLLEQPNSHFGVAVAKLVLFEIFYLAQLEALAKCTDARIAAIAVRAEKEIRYHLRHNSQWLVRLGDGTDESQRRMQSSVNRLWKYTGEMFCADAIDAAFADEYGGPDLVEIEQQWKAQVAALLSDATLEMPDDAWMQQGGKSGIHTEQFGYMLAELQYLPRSNPGATW